MVKRLGFFASHRSLSSFDSLQKLPLVSRGRNTMVNYQGRAYVSAWPALRGHDRDYFEAISGGNREPDLLS
jgi:hypothetical protein